MSDLQVPRALDLELVFACAVVGWPTEGGVQSHALRDGEMAMSLRNETGRLVVIGTADELKQVFRQALTKVEMNDG